MSTQPAQQNRKYRLGRHWLKCAGLICVVLLSACSTQPQAPQLWRSASWEALPGWRADDLTQAWPGLLASCRSQKTASFTAAWKDTCEAAQALGAQASAESLRNFFEARLQPWQIISDEGKDSGLITGYYEPLIQASRTRSAEFTTPIFAVPDDLLSIELGDTLPEALRGQRLRGRLEGRRVLPYWSRAQIDALGEKLAARVLMYGTDPLEILFLQVQGSGQAQLPDGSRVRLAYADQNGHPYKAIGRWLADQGEIPLAEVSMQRIMEWGRTHPARIPELLSSNPSYVFFREESASAEGPQGALGITLQATRSVAVDSRNIPLGAPLFLATTTPDAQALQRTVLAHDTGGAIRGRVRADFFFGFGAEAGALAGRMKQAGQLWLLWPRNQPLPLLPPSAVR